jgi:hypothetical protein
MLARNTAKDAREGCPYRMLEYVASEELLEAMLSKLIL